MTDPAASPPPPPPSRPAPVAGAPARLVPAARRVERTVVTRIDPRSVLRLSALFYAGAFAALFVVGAALWLVAAATGVVGNVESFIGDLFALDDFRFEPLRIVVASVIGGVVAVALGTAANVVAVVLFNRIARAVGGVEMTVVARSGATSSAH